jgi:hypothetical protein
LHRGTQIGNLKHNPTQTDFPKNDTFRGKDKDKDKGKGIPVTGRGGP